MNPTPLTWQQHPCNDSETFRADLLDEHVAAGQTIHSLRFIPCVVAVETLGCTGAAPEDYLFDGDEAGYVKCVEMADIYAEGGELPAITVYRSQLSEHPALLDGYHRVIAAQQAGITHLPALLVAAPH